MTKSGPCRDTIVDGSQAAALAPVGHAARARSSSAQATSIDAAPPSPLKSATSSGMAVIATRLASTKPITEPRATPPARIAHRVSRSASPHRAKVVATTATNMARAAMRFPERALRTRARRSMPRINSRADAM